MATITKGRTFTSGETVTPAKLNDVVDLATVTNIQTADIADGQVTTAKILDANVTTAKILDANVTNAKLATGIDASKLTTGTLPIARVADAAVIPAKLSQPLTLATAQAATSGTSIDFTGIPSWVKRITLILNGVSTSGIGNMRILLGDSGGFETTGYTSTGNFVGISNVGAATHSTGFISEGDAGASTTRSGMMCMTNLSGNVWIVAGSYQAGASLIFLHGKKELSDTLTQIRLTTSNGTDTFDAGSINIMYEG
jgi:hypothetical protein